MLALALCFALTALLVLTLGRSMVSRTFIEPASDSIKDVR
jgi:hypothetical protein